jgi:hypothetical protein
MSETAERLPDGRLRVTREAAPEDMTREQVTAKIKMLRHRKEHIERDLAVVNTTLWRWIKFRDMI